MAHQKRFALQLRLRRREKPFLLRHHDSWLSAHGAEAEASIVPALCVRVRTCVHVSVRTRVCTHVASREGSHLQDHVRAHHIPTCSGRCLCLAVPSWMCPVDVSMPREPCGCPWLLVPLEGDAPSSLCVSFSYSREPQPHRTPWPHHAVLEHEHLGLLWPSDVLSGMSSCPSTARQPPGWGPACGMPGTLGKGFGCLFLQCPWAKRKLHPLRVTGVFRNPCRH